MLASYLRQPVITRHKGKANACAPSTTELMVQSGTTNQASGSIVTFPVAFGATPQIFLTIAGNVPTTIKTARCFRFLQLVSP